MANQKKELPMAAMFVNGSEQNEHYLERIFHRCFLPSFTSFGWGVSEEKIKMWKVNGRQMPSDGKSSHCLWQGELKKYFIDWQHHSYQDSWNHCQSQTIISRIMHSNLSRKNIMTRWSPYVVCITHLVIHEVFGLKKVCKINPLLSFMQGSMLIIVLYKFPSWILDQNKKINNW